MFRFLLGIVLGIILVPVAVVVWLRCGAVPVAVADPPFPREKLITHVPLNARIDREKQNVTLEPNEDNLVAGAQIYRDQCAACHGLAGKPSSFGAHMYPSAPSLWEKHKNKPSVVGVSDDPPGETLWKVENGIRLTGMPSYKQILTDTQMAQVSVLLANADKPLPPAALEILRGETPPAAPPPAPVKKK